jgi:hypothetical protein
MADVFVFLCGGIEAVHGVKNMTLNVYVELEMASLVFATTRIYIVLIKSSLVLEYC